MVSSPAIPTELVAHAAAKLNLYLHITGTRDDSYHLVDSLVVFAQLGDQLRLEVGTAQPLDLVITGPFAEVLSQFATADNLIMRAATALADHTGQTTHGLRFTLDKHLPLAGGIGGGSADAAAAIRLLCGLWGIAYDRADIMALATALGADLPACLISKPVITRGIGEQLTPVTNLPVLPAVLVNPGSAQPTPRVFKTRRALNLPFDRAVSWPAATPFTAHDLTAWLQSHTANGLDAAAKSLAPSIEQALASLNDTEGCNMARMSGSGSTCFGLFGTNAAAEKAATRLQARHPEWWVRATVLAG